MVIFNQNDNANAIAPLITQLVDQLASIVVPALQESLEKVVIDAIPALGTQVQGVLENVIDRTTITIMINVERKKTT